MEREILLVEDNPDDVELTRIAFAEANIGNPLRVAHDGAQALSYLDDCARSGRFPALVLLDLNLPKVNGREVLQAIRGNRAMHGLPVVMLTTSNEPADVESSYALGVNSYIQKPVDFEQFVWAIKQVGLYWLVLNLPREMAGG